MRGRTLAIIVVAMVIIYALLPTPKTVEETQAAGPSGIDSSYKMKDFGYYEEISLKKDFGNLMPDIRIPVYVYGRCYYSQTKRRAVIVPGSVFHLAQPPTSNMTRFNTRLVEANYGNYVAELNVDASYTFNPTPFPKLGFMSKSGYKSFTVFCTTTGTVNSSSMKKLY